MSNQPGNMQDNTPLFQNTDEQEAVYAPQQVPNSASRLDDEVTSDARTDDSPLLSGLVPVAGATGGSGAATGGVVGGGNAAPIVSDAPAQRQLDDDNDLSGSARQ